MGAGFDEQKLSLRQLCVLSEAGNLRPLGAIDLRPPKLGESGRLREGGRVDDWRGGGRRRVTAQLQARLQERIDERALHVVADEIVDQGIRFEAHPRVLRRMNRIIEECRESVSALRVPDHDDNLESALARDAEHFKGERRIDVRLTVKGNPRPLAPLARDAVYQISREALANTFRHTRAKHVEVDVEYSRDDLTVRVRARHCAAHRRRRAPGPSGCRACEKGPSRSARSFGSGAARAAGTEVEVHVPAKTAFPNASP